MTLSGEVSPAALCHALYKPVLKFGISAVVFAQ